MSKLSISHVNNSHNDWLRALAFYTQEISILTGRLTEIAGKYTSKEVAAQVEHFENQFRLQAEHIDRMCHDIHNCIHDAAVEAGQNAGYIDKALLTRHDLLEKAFVVEEKILSDLRHEFNRFAAKWL